MISTERYLIKGGRVFAGNGARECDLLIEDGKVAKIGAEIAADGAQVVDAAGLFVAPGLVDLRCRLREPGFEEKEDIASGTAAAAKGGFTTVCCLPNTDPINDNAVVTAFIREKAAREGVVRVHPVAALTKGMKGDELTEAGDLADAGAVALSDGTKSVRDANRMRLALSYAKTFGLTIVSHAEDEDLTNGGLMNEGYWSTALGLAGATRVAEESVVARDCMLAEIEGAKLHIAHISTAGSAEIVRQAKRRGVRVTCETAPHYLLATDEWVQTYDTNTKVNPPLRTEADRVALIEALKDGTIDCIASDHAPQHIDDKNVEYAIAAPGVSSLETALSVCWTALVKPGHLTPELLFEKMTAAPAAIFGLDAGLIVEGAVADIVVVDPAAEWTVDPAKFRSKGRNTPFAGRTLSAVVKYTFVGGRCVHMEK